MDGQDATAHARALLTRRAVKSMSVLLIVGPKCKERKESVFI